MWGDQVEGVLNSKWQEQRAPTKPVLAGPERNRPVRDRSGLKKVWSQTVHGKGILASHNLKNKNVLNKMYFCVS